MNRWRAASLSAAVVIMTLMGAPFSAAASDSTLASTAATTQVDVVAIGDSITSGHGAGDPRTQSWPAVLGDLNHLVVVNRGFGPNTTTQMRERFDADVLSRAPKYVIILGGIHDFFQFVPRETTKANLRWMAETAAANGIQPYLGTLTPAVPFIPQTASLNAWIRDYANQSPDVGVVDFFTPLEIPSGSGSCPFLVDIVHPDARGYLLMGIAAGDSIPTYARPAAADWIDASWETTLEAPAPGVLANDDVFASGPGLSAELVRGALHGSVELRSDGSFSYRPNDGYLGQDSFLYRARDGAESSAVTSATITVDDTVAPESSALGLQARWSNLPAIVSLISTDSAPGTGVDSTFYRVGSGPVLEYASPWMISSEGVTTIEYWAVDRAGNVEMPHNTGTVRIDKSAPITSSDAKAAYARSAVIRLAASDGGMSGVAATYHRLDGGRKTRGATVVASAVGNHTLQFWSVDAAGNVEIAKTAKFVVTKPRVSLGAPKAPTTIRKSKSYTIHGSLKPKHTQGAKPVRIYLYKKVGLAWIYKGYFKAKAYDYKGWTRYRGKMKLTSRGEWRVRAYAPADSLHAATWSKYDYFTVK